MKFIRVQPYRSVFIAELRAEDYFGTVRPFKVIDGVGVFVAYYVVDDLGEVLHPVRAYFLSPVWAMAGADILIDNPKMFDAKVSGLLRYEEKSLKEF